MKQGQISRPQWLTLLCRPLMTKPSFECKAVWFEPSTATFEIRLDTVSSDSITSIRFIISQCVLGCFSLRLCWLLLGIRLAVTTAQSLNGLQSRIFFFLLLVCLFLLLQNLWKLSVCVSIMWECMDECVCVKLTGPQSRLTGKTSPPFNILNVTVPMVTSFQPPPFLCPACLFWRFTSACLKLSYSPGALSSVGGLIIGCHFQRIHWNLQLQIAVKNGKIASVQPYMDLPKPL